MSCVVSDKYSTCCFYQQCRKCRVSKQKMKGGKCWARSSNIERYYSLITTTYKKSAYVRSPETCRLEKNPALNESKFKPFQVLLLNFETFHRVSNYKLVTNLTSPPFSLTLSTSLTYLLRVGKSVDLKRHSRKKRERNSTVVIFHHKHCCLEVFTKPFMIWAVWIAIAKIKKKKKTHQTLPKIYTLTFIDLVCLCTLIFTRQRARKLILRTQCKSQVERTDAPKLPLFLATYWKNHHTLGNSFCNFLILTTF